MPPEEREKSPETTMLLGVVAHELRTPLAALRAMTEFLLTDGAHQVNEWEVFHRNIHDEVLRLGEMLENLLEGARLASGNARWNWGEFDLELACDEALESVRRLVDRAHVSVEYRVDPPGKRIRGDRDAITRLILNLANNSRKHTTSGGITVEARVCDEGPAQWCEIKVRDTGSGIPPDVVEKLGTAFALNSGAIWGARTGSTGLGVAICKGILAVHGGTLSIESQPGETCVTAKLRADLAGPAMARSEDKLTGQPWRMHFG